MWCANSASGNFSVFGFRVGALVHSDGVQQFIFTVSKGVPEQIKGVNHSIFFVLLNKSSALADVLNEHIDAPILYN